MSPATDSPPYVCITSDTHAGAAIDTYRDYLDPAYRAAFDAWRGRYKNPSKKHIGGKKTKNWDSAERLSDLQSDGVVGEVIFPNTVPPFYASAYHVSPPARPEEYEHARAGTQASCRTPSRRSSATKPPPPCRPAASPGPWSSTGRGWPRARPCCCSTAPRTGTSGSSTPPIASTCGAGIRHLSFGHGVHFCLGASLARLEGVVALDEVLSRWPDWEIDHANAAMARMSTVRGWKRLPARVWPARRIRPSGPWRGARRAPRVPPLPRSSLLLLRCRRLAGTALGAPRGEVPESG